MWKSGVALGLVSCVLFIAATSHSDSAATSLPDPASPEPEPTLENPVMPAPGAATPQHDPFKPYDIGGASAAWAYEDLKPAEQEAADRGADATRWDAINAGYAAASREQNQKDSARALARQLGLDNLAQTGVIP